MILTKCTVESSVRGLQNVYDRLEWLNVKQFLFITVSEPCKYRSCPPIERYLRSKPSDIAPDMKISYHSHRYPSALRGHAVNVTRSFFPCHGTSLGRCFESKVVDHRALPRPVLLDEDIALFLAPTMPS